MAQILEECKESGWDGYNADPIDSELCQAARKFYLKYEIELTAHNADIGPNNQPGISFDLENGKRELYFMVIYTKGQYNIVYLQCRERKPLLSGQIYDWDPEVNYQEIENCWSYLYGE